jgi:hypothetical protein
MLVPPRRSHYVESVVSQRSHLAASRARHQVDAGMPANVAHDPTRKEDADHRRMHGNTVSRNTAWTTALTGAKLWAAHGVGADGWWCLASGKWARAARVAA